MKSSKEIKCVMERLVAILKNELKHEMPDPYVVMTSSGLYFIVWQLISYGKLEELPIDIGMYILTAAASRERDDLIQAYGTCSPWFANWLRKTQSMQRKDALNAN